jgi:hypothetical protein
MKPNILKQIYGGAFENATLAKSSRRALFGAGGVLLTGVLTALIIKKNG